MRWEVVKKFEEATKPHVASIHRVALVGGGIGEAEIEALKKIKAISITYFGIETIPNEDFSFLDLNYDKDFEDTFDLVVCSQVLEHIWNHQAFFDNLSKLVRPRGFLWIGCPASNYPHGSPEYFSAGFAPDYLVNNLGLRNLELLLGGSLGSKRYYFLTHSLQIWGSKNLHKFPIFFGISRYYPREILGRLYSLVLDSRVVEGIKHATETYGFFQKSDKK
jgi:SAM-dependent methyltransferase